MEIKDGRGVYVTTKKYFQIISQTKEGKKNKEN